VYRAVRALGFEPALYLYYESQPMDGKFVQTGLIDRVIQPEDCEEVESFISTLLDHGGFFLRLMDVYGKLKVENVLHLVMSVTTFNRPSSAYVAHGNEALLGLVYGDVCLVVRIGKVGEKGIQPSRNWKNNGKKRDGGKWGCMVSNKPGMGK
jgi:hypothetical protein